MKWSVKFSFLVFILLAATTLFAQGQPPQPDEGMDIFLRTILLIAMCIMFGAAMVGAFVAAFIIGLIALFGSLGLISISFIVGLYKRSLAAGFKTFAALLLAGVGAMVGTAGGLALQLTVEMNLPVILLTGIGFVAGGLGGLLIGFATFKMLRTGLSYLTGRLAK